MTRIILFDGDCNFCDQSVQFIMKHDPKAMFRFASLQSDIGKGYLRRYNAPNDIDSVVLIEDNHCYFKSDAGLRICRNLTGLWKLCYFLLVVPRPVRDFCYDIIAKNRYKWFGKRENCMLPSAEDRKRFL